MSSDADEILLTFTKMQGLGNDFVVISEEELRSWLTRLGKEPPSWAEVARKLCNRNFGIGADGLIVVSLESKVCDAGWTYINSDGSSSLMCGNGLRCLAHWCITNGAVTKKEFTVETGKGPVRIEYLDAENITTDLGEPILNSEAIPVGGPPLESVVANTIELAKRTVSLTCVSMGNPHCVLFDSDIEAMNFAEVATEIQRNSFFPQGVNVSFVTGHDSSRADVIVWERGCGPTLACASGAAAVLVAGVLEGKLQRKADITLPGGRLTVEWRQADNRVLITGPARISFAGSITKSALEAVP